MLLLISFQKHANKMKIFQIINVRWFNATSWYALYLSKLLSEAGHEVLVLTQADTDTERKAREWGLDVVTVDLNTVNPLRLFTTCIDIIQLLKRHRPEIVNCHRGEGFFLWGLLKRAGFRYGLVRTRGDQRLPRNDFFNRWLHASVADGVVVTNQRMADHFLKDMRTPESNLWLIHGGVDNDRYAFTSEGREQVRREFGFQENDLVVGLLGRFDRVKGQKELIEATAKAGKRLGDHVKLFLIGFDTAMNRAQIEEWLNEYGLTDSCRISGKRDDVAACLSALDIGVVASLWSEAIARAALEIMAAGRPLVSTNVGVMPDLVPEEGLVDPGDVDGLAKVIARTATDETFRKFLLEKQKRTLSQLSGSNFLKRSLTLYEKLLERV